MNTFDPNAPAKLGHSKPNANYTILLHWRENPTQFYELDISATAKEPIVLHNALYCIVLNCIVLYYTMCAVFICLRKTALLQNFNSSLGVRLLQFSLLLGSSRQCTENVKFDGLLGDNIWLYNVPPAL